MRSFFPPFVIGMSLTLASAGQFLTAQDATPKQPPPHLLTIVVYKAGPDFKADIPVEKQLAAHFGYVGKQFAAGKLIAYGPEPTCSAASISWTQLTHQLRTNSLRMIPGVKARLLQVDEKLVWATVIHNFAELSASDNFFFFRMQPGASWETGKTLTEQAVGPHFGYMVNQARAGLVLGAGPSATGIEGFYIVKAARSELDKLLADDSGEQSGLLKPVVLPWHVLKMQPVHWPKVCQEEP